MNTSKQGSGPNIQLRDMREQRGWTQNYVADSIGVTTRTVSRWEQGQAFPTPYCVRKLCNLFEANEQELGLERAGPQFTSPETISASPTEILDESQQGVSALPRWRRIALFSVLIAIVVCGLLLGGTLWFDFGSGQSNPNLGTTAAGPACPAPGTARVASMPKITPSGSNQNIVYIENRGTPDHPLSGAILRRDVTAHPSGNDRGATISAMPGIFVSEAQISADHQWILFTASVAGQYQLRLVRIDGQKMQTLYCAPHNTIISHVQWSLYQQLLVFDQASGPALASLYSLNVTTGQLKEQLLPQNNLYYIPRAWLNSSQVVVVSADSNISPQNIYVLTLPGSPDRSAQISQVMQKITPGCTDFDTNFDQNSLDSTKLFVSQCTNQNPVDADLSQPENPSLITIVPKTGGLGQPAFNSRTLAITAIRSISRNRLLALVENATDTSQNGLWKITIDARGVATGNPTRLSQDANHTQSLCQFSQSYWANESLNGEMYALQAHNTLNDTYSLLYSSLDGGSPVQVVQTTGIQISLVGWIQM